MRWFMIGFLTGVAVVLFCRGLWAHNFDELYVGIVLMIGAGCWIGETVSNDPR